MQIAVIDLHTGLRRMSTRKAAVAYNLAFLQDRLAGSHQRVVVYYDGRQLLTPRLQPLDAELFLLSG